jgi:ketosteroid isomerase-like protein
MINAISMFRKLMPEGLKFNIVSITADGDRVAVEWQGRATLADGKPYHNNYVMVFVIKDGKIKQLNEYFDTLLVDDVMWPLISGSGF